MWNGSVILDCECHISDMLTSCHIFGVIFVPRYCRGRMIWMMKPTTSLLRKLEMRGMMWANSTRLHIPILHQREKVLRTPKAFGGSNPLWGNRYIWRWKRVFHIGNKSKGKIYQGDDATWTFVKFTFDALIVFVLSCSWWESNVWNWILYSYFHFAFAC